MAEALGTWTKEASDGGQVVTGCDHTSDRSVVGACGAMGWKAAAKGYPGEVLPVARNEYLALDVVAFSETTACWPFPTAVFELENSQRR